MGRVPDRALLESSRDGRRLVAVARAVAEAGGRALVVGGWVRDVLAGEPPGDLDLEVHGLSREALGRVLDRFGSWREVGRAFGVFRVRGIDADLSLPRGPAPGVPAPVGFDFDAAARGRDLTANAIGFDPLSEAILDPLGGRRDVERGVLRAADPSRFGEDPLRAMRVAGLAARFGWTPDPTLVALAARLEIAGVAAERVFAEWRKLLAVAARPSLGLAFLRAAQWLRFFPEVEDLVAVPQDPRWHPEGDVWTHTLLVVDRAAALRTGDGPDDEALGFAALAHDFGKPATTARERGRVRSVGHDALGAGMARAWLERWRAPRALATRVEALVHHHLAPALLVGGGAGARAYRRLARRLGRAGVSMALLERLARADHLGRTTDDALAGRFAAGDRFLREAAALAVRERPPDDAVRGRDLIARGLPPGPRFGEILRACRERQDATGERDPERLLDAVLGAGDDGAPGD